MEYRGGRGQEREGHYFTSSKIVISYYFESELFMYMTALQYTILVKLPPLFINLEVSPKYIHVQMLSRYPPCKQTQGLFSTMILYIVTLCLRYKVNL